jgi:hypothetical protein
MHTYSFTVSGHKDTVFYFYTIFLKTMSIKSPSSIQNTVTKFVPVNGTGQKIAFAKAFRATTERKHYLYSL